MEEDVKNQNQQNDGGDGDNSAQNQQNEKKEKTFTQEEVTAMMAKEKNQGRASMLNELGFKDAKSAKASLASLKEYEDAKKTDLDKANENIAAETAAKKEAENKVTMLELKLSLVKSGVKVESIDDVSALIVSKMSDDKTIDDVLKELKEHSVYKNFFASEADDDDNEAKKSGTGKNVNGKRKSAEDGGIGSRLGAQKAKQDKKSESAFFKN